jgi:ribosomal protein S27AE
MCDVLTTCPRCGGAIMTTDSHTTVDGLIYHLVCGSKEKVKPLSRWEQERIRRMFTRSNGHG